MIKKLSVYSADSKNPYINLATEQYLFDSLDTDEAILYLWQNENTVVIGKNQNVWTECSYELMKKDGVLLARRMSGGGAVYHDLGNLNFTFINSKNDDDINRNMQIIKTACQYTDISAEVSGRNDILAEGKKFSGNAFYNSKGKAYHHGTIMINADGEKLSRYLTPSKAKLEAKGIKSVKSRVINLSELNPRLGIDLMKGCLIKAAEEVLGVKAKVHKCTINNEILRLSDIYSSDEHLLNSQPPFDFLCEGQFPWGNVQIRLSIKKGFIDSAFVYTDSMDWEFSEKTKKALTGCRLNKIENSDVPPDIKKLIMDNLGI